MKTDNQKFMDYYESPERRALTCEEAQQIIEKVKKENPNLSFEQKLRKIREEMQDLLFNKLYG